MVRAKKTVVGNKGDKNWRWGIDSSLKKIATRGNKRREGSMVKRGVFVVFKMGEISRNLCVGGNDIVEGKTDEAGMRGKGWNHALE